MIRYFLVCILVICETSAQSQSWKQLEDFPGDGRDDGVSITVGDHSYYGTGRDNSFAFLNDWWRFDHNTKSWDTLSSLPGLPRQYAAISSMGNNIYLMGGIGQNDSIFNEIWKYNISSDEWSLVGYLPEGKRIAPLLVKSGHQFIFGMGSDGTSCKKDLYTWDPNIKNWEQLTQFPGNPKQQTKAFCTKTSLVVGSGRCGGDCYYDWYQFDLKNKIWSPYTAPDSNFCSYQFEVDNNSTYITGGGMIQLNDITPNNFSQKWYYYDKNKQHWQTLPDFPNTPRRSGATFYHNSTLTIVSGLNSIPERIKEVWELKLTETPISSTDFYYISQNESLIIYPEHQLRSFEIFYIDGKLMHQQNKVPQNQEIFISTSGWQKGVYLVRLKDKFEIKVKRVFIF